MYLVIILILIFITVYECNESEINYLICTWFLYILTTLLLHISKVGLCNIIIKKTKQMIKKTKTNKKKENYYSSNEFLIEIF